MFARKAIAPGTVIETAPALIIPAADCPVLDRTIIHDYYFHWDGDPEGSGRGAVGLGLVTLCNHASRATSRGAGPQNSYRSMIIGSLRAAAIHSCIAGSATIVSQ